MGAFMALHQQRIDRRVKLEVSQGLGDVRVASGKPGLFLVFLHRHRRERDHGDVAVAGRP
jgi:hypothetical protein